MEANKLHQLKELIEKRPKVYGWLKVQRILFWFYLLFALILLWFTFFHVFAGLFADGIIKGLSEEIARSLDMESKTHEIYEILYRFFEPYNALAIFNYLLLSIAFFGLARYSIKVVNRNNYILKIEECIKNP